MANANARRLAILKMVRDRELVRVSELSQRFGVSEVSIRRDLTKLGEYGLLRRVHGGAVVSPQLASGDMARANESDPRLGEKKRIGRAAASLIRSGDRIILDSGTTVLEVAREIAEDSGMGQLTVTTASLPAFTALAVARNVHLVVLGGIYLPDYQTLVGPQTMASLQGLHVDKLFLGADGLSRRSGVTTANMLEAEVSRAMAQAAAEIIVVSDSSKIDNVGFTTIIPLTEVHTLITDDQAPPDFVAAVRRWGAKVMLV